MIYDWLAFINQFSIFFFLIGLAAVTALNFWKWAGDQRLARQLVSKSKSTIQLKAMLRVSVLVAAWNEAAIIDTHLQSIQAIHYPHLEYILCAGGNDGTLEIARQYASEIIKVIEQEPGEGKQKALQHCLNAATGELIFLTDADCLLNTDTFTRTMAPIINEGEAVVTGTSAPLPRQMKNPQVLQQWFAQVYAQAWQGKYIGGILGRNAAMRREVLKAAGDFELDVPTGTDYYLAKQFLRNGYCLRYERLSEVKTPYPEYLREYWNQQARWLRNVVIYGLQFKAFGEVLQCLVPSVIGILMLTGPLLAIFFGPIIFAFWLLAWLHVLFSRLRYIRFGEIVTGCHFFSHDYFRIPGYALIDFVVWSWVLFQYPLKSLRRQW
jgi:cellulose synthase/poly-beta-1,6-N-acetylglucosamine synthase-like glycosyltransferase